MVQYVQDKHDERHMTEIERIKEKSKNNKDFLFTEAMLFDQMITEMLEKNADELNKILDNHWEDQDGDKKIQVNRTKEIWLLMSMTMRAVMVKAGAQIATGTMNVKNDPDCLDALFKHMCLYVKEVEKEEKTQTALESPRKSVLK